MPTDRIIERAQVDPRSLIPHPQNFRRHPKEQASALRNILSGVGTVENPLVNQRTGRVVDGHLRVEEAIAANAPLVWVDYCDLTDEEERLALATHDPISALSVHDSAKLDALLARAGALADPMAPTIQGSVAGREIRDGKTPQEGFVVYQGNPLRQVIVHYSITDWETLTTRLDALVAAGGYEDRAACVLALLNSCDAVAP